MDLNIHNLKCGYHNNKKLSYPPYSVSLIINNPSLVVLIGNNGIGKTTFLKTLAGLLKSIHGHIKYNQIIFNNIPSSKLANYISYLPAINSKIPYITVKDFVKFGLYRLKKNKEKNDNKIIIILEELNIAHKINDYIHHLSDGEFQLVNIARIFVQDTPIVLLDEATSHLDKDNRLVLYRFLLNKTNEGKIIIFSSHFWEETLPFVHKVLIFDKKNYLFILPEEFYLKYGEEFNLKLFKINTLNKSMQVIGDGIPFICTYNALIKHNVKLDEKYKVIILQNKDKILWVLKKENKFVNKFDSLETMINYLKNLKL